MKKTLLILLTVATLIFAADGDKLIGKYRIKDMFDIEIFKDNQTYSGKIIALNGINDGNTKDIHNRDKERRNDNLVGKKIITNLVYSPEKKKWVDGKMYVATKGVTINLTVLSLNEKGAEVLGQKLVMRKKIQWIRIK